MIAEVTYISRKPIGVSDKELKDYQAECKANAHLIAASPDLLDALKASNEKLQALLFSGDGHHLVRANLAAIAKAEGRS
jgi:hypothetical protein